MMRCLAVVVVAACSSQPPPAVVAEETVAGPRSKTSTTSAYARHMEALQARLAEAGLGDMNLRIEEPFVVAGNDSPPLLARRAATVRWAVALLEADFFDTRPDRILDVFLWNDAASYRRGVKALTGGAPGTPYGFYSSADDGLFMNIATGGGTLVHELVHPYVEADFPGAPPWLNEGLGSLFEQSSERDGHIVGETNWRLEGLQDAIRDQRVPTFRALAKMSEHQFYVKDRGTNYAQARYLLYYLQEEGTLRDFYARFRAARAADPTGYDTLVAVLGERDMTAFQKRWEAWVLELRFED